MSYHEAVLAEESVEGLAIRPTGIYVDTTFGGGGHSRLILERLQTGGRLLGFDQDADAAANVPESEAFQFVAANFRHLKRFLRLYGVREVDGILADLGVSSHQLDEEARGFSYRFDSPLDMRMNQAQRISAADVLNTYTAGELQRVFGTYGEVRNAKTLAGRIVEERQVRPVNSISTLLQIVEPLIRGQRLRYLSQVFQAIRIEVNDEMGALEELLDQSLEVLKPGGRLVVISYHSLEDRMVKNFMRSGSVKGNYEKDFYGNIYRPFKLITKKAVVPTTSEIEENPRARSARLRIAEKLDTEWQNKEE